MAKIGLPERKIGPRRKRDEYGKNPYAWASVVETLPYLSLPPQPEAQPYGFFFWAFTRSIGLMGSREEGSSVAVLTAPQIRSYLCRTAERSLFNGKLWMWAGVSLALLRV